MLTRPGRQAAIDSRLCLGFVPPMWTRVKQGNARARVPIFTLAGLQATLCYSTCARMCVELRIENSSPKTENENEGVETRVQARVQRLEHR